MPIEPAAGTTAGERRRPSACSSTQTTTTTTSWARATEDRERRPARGAALYVRAQRALSPGSETATAIHYIYIHGNTLRRSASADMHVRSRSLPTVHAVVAGECETGGRSVLTPGMSTLTTPPQLGLTDRRPDRAGGLSTRPGWSKTEPFCRDSRENFSAWLQAPEKGDLWYMILIRLNLRSLKKVFFPWSNLLTN
jgi:hypothetical protein